MGQAYLAPALTLMEVLVALAIWGLVAGVAISNLGPWMASAQATRRDATLWRGVPAAQIVLDEFTAGAVVSADARAQLDRNEARFEAYVPRLHDAPFQTQLRIETTDAGDNLVLSASALERDIILLSSSQPLRLRARGQRISVEGKVGANWRPILLSRMSADAPLVCAYDSISRACR